MVGELVWRVLIRAAGFRLAHLLEVRNRLLGLAVLDVHHGQFEAGRHVGGIGLGRFLIGAVGRVELPSGLVKTGEQIPRMAVVSIDQQGLVTLPLGVVILAEDGVGFGPIEDMADHERSDRNQRDHDQDDTVRSVGDQLPALLPVASRSGIDDLSFCHSVPRQPTTMR